MKTMILKILIIYLDNLMNFDSKKRPINHFASNDPLFNK